MGIPSGTIRESLLPPDMRRAKPRAKRFEGRATALKQKRLAAVVAVTGGNTCLIPVKTVSEANARGHWSKRAVRAKVQRELTRLMVSRLDLPALPVVVTLTRIGKRMLDTGDNLNTSLKAARDGVADAFGVDDGDLRYRWEYAQEIGAEYGVRVAIDAA